MKNWINYTKYAIVNANAKRGYSRPVKIDVRTFKFFEELTEENAKLRFAPLQITFEKYMTIKGR